MVLSSMQLQKVSVTLWFRRLQCLVLRSVLSVFINLHQAGCVCLSYGLRVCSQTNKLSGWFHFTTSAWKLVSSSVLGIFGSIVHWLVNSFILYDAAHTYAKRLSWEEPYVEVAQFREKSFDVKNEYHHVCKSFGGGQLPVPGCGPAGNIYWGLYYATTFSPRSAPEKKIGDKVREARISTSLIPDGSAWVITRLNWCHAAKWSFIPPKYNLGSTVLTVATSPLALRWMCDSPRTECARRTTNNGVIVACDVYCCLLPRCEALRTWRSGFPIATILSG